MALDTARPTEHMNAAVNSPTHHLGYVQPTEEMALRASMDGFLPWCETGIAMMLDGTVEFSFPQQ